MGIAGFVTSLIGLLSCGFLSPLGLLFSFFGLFKAPRGLAIAGTILGAIGSLWLIVAGFAMVMTVLGLSKAASTIADMTATRTASQKAFRIIDDTRQRQGSLPTDAEGTKMISSLMDPWGTPLAYRRNADTFSVVSFGKDKVEGTTDDLSFTESELKPISATAPTTEAEDAIEEETEVDSAKSDEK
jgi:hypothetical protein